LSTKSARSFGESDRASENIFSDVSDMTRSILLKHNTMSSTENQVLSS
jgi:hypothetical protein